jgi:hypothetical protein
VTGTLARVARGAVKRVSTTNARFLLRTQYDLWQEGGVARMLRWNGMLADAWVRDRLARRHYDEVDSGEASALRKSKTVFVFGSGWSLNTLSDQDWLGFRDHDVFGFNAFYRQQWVPVDFHLFRGGIYGSLRWRPYAREVQAYLMDNPLYASTTFVLQSEYLGHFCNQLTGYAYLPRRARVLRFHTTRAPGPATRRLAEGVRHATGTLEDAVNVAYCLGWQHIVLVGVDLYDSRYFYLPADATTGLDDGTGLLGPSEFNTYRGIRYDQTHSTARHGVIDVMRAWRNQFNADGIELWVYNPKSLLAQALPTYEPAWRSARTPA